jgi:ADP-ribosylglycohydrolase/tetratricopeptide (TPR) repeat protein
VTIFDQIGGTGPSVERDRALELFQDRVEIIRRFAWLLNEDPPPTRLLFLHGMGGTGKSLMLRYLEARCCVRMKPQDWLRVRELPDDEVAAVLSGVKDAKSVPVARIDFSARPAGENRPQEAFSGLFMLKRQLARWRVATPRFDFAAVTYLHKLGLDLRQRLPELFPKGELSLALGIADALLPVSPLQLTEQFYEIVNARLDDLFTRKKVQRRLPKQEAERILSLQPEPDLLTEMPAIFAADLAAAVGPEGKHQRLVLLLDGHEAFFGEAIADPHSLIHAAALARDEWLRRLLGNLPLHQGVIAVISGRTQPFWDAAPVSPIPDSFVDLVHVGSLSAVDAMTYLEKAGVAVEALRHALVAYASDDGGVHPYYLGLCADVALAAAARGQALDPRSFRTSAQLTARDQELAGLLLRWTQPDDEYRLMALAACRSFTYDTFSYLGQQLGFGHEWDDFARLVGFSFVRPLSGGSARTEARQAYVMHSLLRRALAGVRPEQLRRAHRALAARYAAMAADGDFTAQLEQIYHQGHLHPHAGIAQWLAAMDVSLATGRYDHGRALISLLGNLPPGNELDRGRCAYWVARASLGLGRVGEAETIAAWLPPTSPDSTLLRAEIAFVHGEFDRAETLARAARDQVFGSERALFAFRLGEIELYLGHLAEATETARAGLEQACAEGDVLQTIRWKNLLAECEYFNGNVTDARDRIVGALAQMEALPEDERDQALHANVLQNAALTAIPARDWGTALARQRQALAIRRSNEDARGIAQSLHGIGIAQRGLGQLREAETALMEAGQAAADLGDQILTGKVACTLAEVRAAQGRLEEAAKLARQALDVFRRAAGPYDVASAQLTLAVIVGQQGHGIERVACLDEARAAITRGGFGTLPLLYPDAAPPDVGRIQAGLTAFAAGDALGVPWEGKPAADIDVRQVAEIPQRPGWPRGAVSDDTVQMIVTARHLIATNGDPDPVRFIAELAAAFPEMRGFGRTTHEAILRYQQTGQVGAVGGSTNGALMRILPAGWAIPASHAERRRDVVRRLTTVTHAEPSAVAAACATAVMASYALEGCSRAELATAAIEELRQTGLGVTDVVTAAAEGRWQPGPDGVPLNAIHTLAAIVHVLVTGPSELADAMIFAVTLGGDTDTVAAITGGILGPIHHGFPIPWRDRIDIPSELNTLASRLAQMRQAAYG